MNLCLKTYHDHLNVCPLHYSDLIATSMYLYKRTCAILFFIHLSITKIYNTVSPIIDYMHRKYLVSMLNKYWVFVNSITFAIGTCTMFRNTGKHVLEKCKEISVDLQNLITYWANLKSCNRMCVHNFDDASFPFRVAKTK